MMSSCGGGERIYYDKNGHVRHIKQKKMPSWYTAREKGYDKYSRNSLKLWDRSLR